MNTLHRKTFPYTLLSTGQANDKPNPRRLRPDRRGTTSNWNLGCSLSPVSRSRHGVDAHGDAHEQRKLIPDGTKFLRSTSTL